jgi:hypothetical protein
MSTPSLTGITNTLKYNGAEGAKKDIPTRKELAIAAQAAAVCPSSSVHVLTYPIHSFTHKWNGY